MATSCTGAVTAAAEERNQAKYSYFDHGHSFTPVAIETWELLAQSLDFLKELGRRIRQQTGEAKSFPYLLQRLSVAVQRGNLASVLGFWCV